MVNPQDIQDNVILEDGEYKVSFAHNDDGYYDVVDSNGNHLYGGYDFGEAINTALDAVNVPQFDTEVVEGEIVFPELGDGDE